MNTGFRSNAIHCPSWIRVYGPIYEFITVAIADEGPSGHGCICPKDHPFGCVVTGEFLHLVAQVRHGGVGRDGVRVGDLDGLDIVGIGSTDGTHQLIGRCVVVGRGRPVLSEVTSDGCLCRGVGNVLNGLYHAPTRTWRPSHHDTTRRVSYLNVTGGDGITGRNATEGHKRARAIQPLYG